MSEPSQAALPTGTAAVREAAERLAERLQQRQGDVADLDECGPAVPKWWREGLATLPIFGDGLASLPSDDDQAFSRPVSFLSAREITMVAGGEFLPLAWMDGGTTVALVHDDGDLPLVCVALEDMQRAGGAGARGVPLADRLSDFLDSLRPQTVCRMASPEGSATIELVGDMGLKFELGGVVEEREFDSADEVGAFVAAFLDQVIEAGFQLQYCSSKMRPLVTARIAEVNQRSSFQPESRARAAILHLLADGSLELEEELGVPTDDGDYELDEDDLEALEDLIDAAARFLERNGRARNLPRRFGEWLSQARGVVDLYADDDAVREALKAPVPAEMLIDDHADQLDADQLDE